MRRSWWILPILAVIAGFLLLRVPIRVQIDGGSIEVVWVPRETATGPIIETPIPTKQNLGTRVVSTAVTTELVQATATEFEIPYQSVVKITALYKENGRLVEGWSGSGSIITADGLILTNAHVVLPDRFFPVDALLISLTIQPEQLPVDMYYAEVVQADWGLDLAVIRIISDLSESPLDQPLLGLPVVPTGDSDQFQLGDLLQILGYPGIGGGTITLTRGEVSGFTSEVGYGERAFIKTSGTIAGGNSGGLVTDRFGQLVAIPTELGYGGEGQFVDCRVIADTNRDGEIDDTDNCVPTGGFINALRPINLALPLIEAAKRGEYNIVEEPKPDLELPEGNVTLYSDDFSDPSSGWSQDAIIDGFVGYLNGEYLVQVDIENYLYWGLAWDNFSDTVITVKARVVTPVGDGEYGIICRYVDEYNFYYLTITEDGWFSIWKLEDDEFTALLDWDYSQDIPQYGTVEITAVCSSNQLSLAVDDVVLGNVTDYTFTKGGIGLVAGTVEERGLQVAFDDLEVKSPTEIQTPTSTPGLIIVDDDFSQQSDSWLWCDECDWSSSSLKFGPYPISGAEQPHLVICEDCGEVMYYKMAVDITYGEGPSERGFGLLVRYTDDYFYSFEITPWQDFDFWKYDFNKDQWTWINGLWSGSVVPGRGTNRLEVEVYPSGAGKVDVALRVNGVTPIVIFSQPAEAGFVGFTLYGHATSAFFDNFEFEELEP